MVRDLAIPVGIVGCPIVREADGLALSSRNAYLSEEQRRQALVLHRALKRAREMADAGERSAEKLKSVGRSEFEIENSVRLDYFEIVNPDTLEAVEELAGEALVAVAAFVGTTRLIDNVSLRETSR